MKPTKDEVEKEITTLSRLKPVGRFRRKTERCIAAAIRELSRRISDKDMVGLSRAEQDTVAGVREWLDGDPSNKPSSGWEGLVL